MKTIGIGGARDSNCATILSNEIGRNCFGVRDGVARKFGKRES